MDRPFDHIADGDLTEDDVAKTLSAISHLEYSIAQILGGLKILVGKNRVRRDEVCDEICQKIGDKACEANEKYFGQSSKDFSDYMRESAGEVIKQQVNSEAFHLGGGTTRELLLQSASEMICFSYEIYLVGARQDALKLIRGKRPKTHAIRRSILEGARPFTRNEKTEADHIDCYSAGTPAP